ncbi:hypothetical protein [Thermomonospora cellulosilytica]|uniref:Putative MFS family arabinose efflux permease n=1 Tax=Thermomonospora cellulosilytica TaxID=1411118 RepID=A0A7W3N0C6_9ACTN|nr:hypothetical protein [Thermomonospora cellulosilytica]MBA9005216.1 putative MFS family arabinose efflux permease [Thermomonospora cellulosilytica]
MGPPSQGGGPTGGHGAFSLAAGLGAVLGGAIAIRLGYARTTTAPLIAAVLPLLSVLALPG